MNTATNNEIHFCDYGCGQEAHYEFENGKWCCCESYNKCPALIKINREKAIQRRKEGIYDSEEFRRKISHPAWNKGKILKPKILHPRKCETCGKEHDGSYGSGRFCCQSCARKASTINDKHRDQTKLKISKTLINRSAENKLHSSIQAALTYNKNHPNKPIKIPQKIHVFKEYINENDQFVIKVTRPRYKCKICGCIDCNQPNICNYLKRAKISNFEKLGFNAKTLGSIEVYNEINKIISKLYDLYINQKLPVQKIQKMYNLTDWFVIYDWMRRFGIPIRPPSDAINVGIETGRIDYSKINTKNQYKVNKHVSWNGKEFILRSSYELDFAKDLDKKFINYEVESLKIPYLSTISNKTKISIPDFYLPDTNEIYEIKGDFTYNKKDIEDRFKTYQKIGFSKIVLVLEHKEYEYPNLPDQKLARTIDNYWN